jgi:septal ring-binding cell division protein DamX
MSPSSEVDQGGSSAVAQKEPVMAQPLVSQEEPVVSSGGAMVAPVEQTETVVTEDEVVPEETAPVNTVVDQRERSAEEQKKIQQTVVKLDKVTENQPVEVLSSSGFTIDNAAWLQNKMVASKQWLKNADRQGVSIQVMMRNASAFAELARYLRNEWPLDLDKTYIYEVEMKGRRIFRVFYDEFPTISQGYSGINQLPESVRVNSPYLHSIYRMQQALLQPSSGLNVGKN